MMPLSRNNLLLLGVLALQIIIGVVLVILPRGGGAQAQGGPLLADFDTGAVTRLSITDNNGVSINLARQNDAWVLPDADDYPVQANRVAELLDKIADLRADRLIAESSSSHRRLEVASDRYQRRIEINQGGDSQALYIGTAAGANATHTRRDGDERVYLTGGLASWELNPQPTAWVDPVYFQIDQNTIVALRITNNDGIYEFEKLDDEWVMRGLEPGETFDPATLTGLLSQSATIRLQRPLGKENLESYGIDLPLAEVIIRTKEPLAGAEPDDDGEIPLLDGTYRLWVGSLVEDENAYYFKASTSEYYVTVAGFVAQNFTDKSREDFLLMTEAPPLEMPFEFPGGDGG